MDGRRQSGSSNGFLFGVIVGVVLTLLLSTKKGRKMLRTLTEEGLDKVSTLEDLFDEDYLEEGETDYVKEVPEDAAAEEVVEPKSRVKAHKPRLFRGIPKRSTAYKN